MIVWAVQHIPSGGFLPRAKGRDGRGGTHVEPTLTEPPRVFTAKQHAQCALTNWLSGKVTVRVYGGFDDVHEDWKTEKVESRKAEDMRVVALRLEVVE